MTFWSLEQIKQRLEKSKIKLEDLKTLREDYESVKAFRGLLVDGRWD